MRDDDVGCDVLIQYFGSIKKEGFLDRCLFLVSAR